MNSVFQALPSFLGTVEFQVVSTYNPSMAVYQKSGAWQPPCVDGCISLL